MHDRTEGASEGRTFLITLLGDFVADAPHHDGRVVSVTADQHARVLLVPGIEQQAVVVRRLARAPDVERLVHDEDPFLVGVILQLGSGRIVARADRVRPHLDQHVDLPVQRAFVQRRAERAEIVVHAHTLNIEPFAVDGKPVGVERQRADAERRLVAIEHHAVLQDCRHRDVAIGCLSRRTRPRAFGADGARTAYPTGAGTTITAPHVDPG